MSLLAEFHDKGSGTVDVRVSPTGGTVTKRIDLIGTGTLKTSTFLIKNAVFPGKKFEYDFVYQSTGDDMVLSFVRIISLK